MFDNPVWKEAQDLTKSDYLGVAINQNEIIPHWDGVSFKWKDGRKTRTVNKLSGQMFNPNFWWIIVRYIGDGWRRTQGGIIICCAKDELPEITERLEGVFHYNVIEERTVYKIYATDELLQDAAALEAVIYRDGREPYQNVEQALES